ncbi:hypothetical protein BGW39_000334, partial [Mortierella sp. 14UC]
MLIVLGRPDTGDETRKVVSDIPKDRLLIGIHKGKMDGPAKATVQCRALGSMGIRNVKNFIQKLLR